MGKLIVVEGLDGSGKATQTNLLQINLEKSGYSVKHISFPDYAEPSSGAVKMYLGGEFGTKPKSVNPYAASAFFAVDRCASFLKNWKNEYEAGVSILADRYTTSNMIYQLTKIPRDDWTPYLAWLADFEYEKLGLPRPDLTVFLDMPVEISQTLMDARYQKNGGKKDIHEADVDYLKQCRETAWYAAARFGWKIIPCSSGKNPRTIPEIAADLFALAKGV